MTDHLDQVATQLRSELGATAYRIGLLAGPDAAVEWERTIHGRCDGIARAMCSPDENEAADAVVHVMGALWFFADPEVCGLADWWGSPLGRACARVFEPDEAREVKRWRPVPNRPDQPWPSTAADYLVDPYGG